MVYGGMFSPGRMLAGLLVNMLSGSGHHRHHNSVPLFSTGGYDQRRNEKIGALFGGEEQRFKKFMERDGAVFNPQGGAPIPPPLQQNNEPPPLPGAERHGRPDDPPSFEDASPQGEIDGPVFDDEEEDQADVGGWFVEVPEADLDKAPAVRVLRAMVAAAHADGKLTSEEQEAIEGRLEGLPHNEREFVHQEIGHPRKIAQIVEGVEDRETKELIFMAAVATLRADGQVDKTENAFASALVKALGFSKDEAQTLARRA